MHILVTGGTGFIGSHFVAAALARGHRVTVVRRSEKSWPRIPWDTKPNYVNKCMFDVSTEDLVGIDAVVHLAAHSANVPYDNIAECLHWNVVAPLSLFYRATAAGIGRYIVAGSCFEYGEVGNDYQFIPIDAPIKATASYPASKAAASIIFRCFAREANVELSLQRIFHVYGEGEPSGRLWPSLRDAALAGRDFPMTAGEQLRDFIPVEQVAEHLLEACSDKSIIAGEAKIENIGTGQPRTVRQFAEYWWEHWNATGKLLIGELPYREGEVMRYVPAITTTKRSI